MGFLGEKNVQSCLSLENPTKKKSILIKKLINNEKKQHKMKKIKQ